MSTKFFTNREGNTLSKKIEAVFENNPGIKYFDALVGFVRASGYFHLRPFMDKLSHVRILVGINVDQMLATAQMKGLEFFANHTETKEEFIEKILTDIEKAEYSKETEDGILQFIRDIADGRIEVKSHPSKRIHAKIYIFYQDIHNQHNQQRSVITGSSNLTASGLGLNDNHNYEFNVLLDAYDDVKYAWDEFDFLWKESVSILPVDANAIRHKSYLKDDFTPFGIYIKMLIEYFGKRVEYDPYNIELLLPDKYMRLKYQTDAANQGYAIMMKHNGFILADVVGLGKTIIACMVIKKFIYENGTHSRVLIVCPPAIKDNWLRTSEDFQVRNHFTFITIGSLDKILDENNVDFPNPDKYDLIIVDESHKFRNDYTEMYIKLQEICKRPRSRPGENGDIRKKTILISATPLNNRPDDIENQLYLFQDRRNSTLDSIKNLQDYFKPINDRYKKLAAEPRLNIRKLQELFNQLRNDVIEPLVIRRTRSDIMNSDDYKADLKDQKIVFPKVDDPAPMHYELDAGLAELFYRTVDLIGGVDENGNEIPGAIGYYRYRSIEFLLKEEDRKIYGNVESISRRLRNIMRTFMVKRLESSFAAFKRSIKNLQQACLNMINMFEDDEVLIAPDLDVNKMLEEGKSYDEIFEKMEAKGGNNRKFSSKAFDAKFIDWLKADKKKIDKLVQEWSRIPYDPKLQKFLEDIENEFFNKNKNVTGKLVIFTEAKDTAALLATALNEIGKEKVLTVSSENRNEVRNIIRNNFDANIDEKDWQYDYDIIVTTEVLAEGVNLHRSNMIINYDVPWNSTRLMQRIGRVNRIGSRAKKIYIYNYYPSAEGDAEIRLVNLALRKLQAFHTAFGEDNRIFSLLEEVGEGGLYGAKVQQEESEILKFLIELRAFRKKNPVRYKEIEKMPAKARCGRDTQVIVKEQIPVLDADEQRLHLPASTVSYLKAENHPGLFFYVGEANVPVQLNFLQAARLFKAAEEEMPAKLHEQHFEQTNVALQTFQSEAVQQQFEGTKKSHFNPEENKALTNLRLAIKHCPTPQKKEVINKAIDAVRSGQFSSKGLPKELNAFFATHSKKILAQQELFYEELFKQVLERYNLDIVSETENKIQITVKDPSIVLTESFS